jgi:hypothetical protein
MHATVALALIETPALDNTTTFLGMDGQDATRIVLTILAIGALLVFAYLKMVRGLNPTKTNLGNFVAFNVVVATLIGAATVVIATRNWTTILLVSGACLGAGFLFGLLFGFPLSNKPSPAKPANQGGAGDANTTPSGRNLFQQSADSLSKLVAGATLVQAQTLYNYFILVAGEVAKCAYPPCCPPNTYTFGAAVTLYFLILGFLAGLLLPHFYDLIEAVPGGPAPDDPEQPLNPAPNKPNPPAQVQSGILNIPPPDQPNPVPEPAPEPAPVPAQAEQPQLAVPDPPAVQD